MLNDDANVGGNAVSGDNSLAINSEADYNTRYWRIDFVDPTGLFNLIYFKGMAQDMTFM